LKKNAFNLSLSLEAIKSNPIKCPCESSSIIT
jgi:hypothetical protein